MNKGVGIILALVLLLIAAAGVVGAVLYFNKSDDESKGDRFIVPLPNNQGYAVKDGTESFVPYRRSRVLPRPRGQRSGRVERMTTVPTEVVPPEPQEAQRDEYDSVDTEIPVLEQIIAGTFGVSCASSETCRELRYDTNDDYVWLLTRFYEEIRDGSMEYLRTVPELREAMEEVGIVNENPLTIRIRSGGDGTRDVVIGVDEGYGLADSYMLVLVAYKKEGKTLPRPDPSLNYVVEDRTEIHYGESV